jgi:hypothetical protein
LNNEKVKRKSPQETDMMAKVKSKKIKIKKKEKREVNWI